MSFVFSCVPGIISLFIDIYFPAGFAEKQSQHLLNRTRPAPEMTSHAIAPAPFFDDAATAKNALATMLQDTDIMYLVLADGAGRVLVAPIWTKRTATTTTNGS